MLAAVIAALTVGPLTASLALWACHGLSAAAGFRFLTPVIPVFYDVDCYHFGAGSEILTRLRSCAGRS